MDSYADHPQAKRIYALALKRRPANYRRPQPPITAGSAAWAGQRASYDYVSPRQRSKATRNKVSRVLRQVRKNVMRQRFTVTEELLAQRSVPEIGRAHVCTPVPNAHPVSRPLLANTNTHCD